MVVLLTEEEKKRRREEASKISQDKPSTPKPTSREFIRKREKRISELAEAGQTGRKAEAQASREARTGSTATPRQVQTPEQANINIEAKTGELSNITGFAGATPTEVALLGGVSEGEKQAFIKQELLKTGEELGIPSPIPAQDSLIGSLVKAGIGLFSPKETVGLNPEQANEVQREELTTNTNKALTSQFKRETAFFSSISGLLGKASVFGVSVSDITGGETERLDFERRFNIVEGRLEQNVQLINDLQESVTRGMPIAQAEELLSNYNDSVNRLEQEAKLLANVSASIASSGDVLNAQGKILESRVKIEKAANSIARIAIGGVGEPASDVELLMFNERVKKRRADVKGGS